MVVSNRRKFFSDLFPVPEFLLLSVTGIMIRDINTKFVQLRRKMFGDGFELEYFNTVDNPKGAIESGLVNDPSGLIPILQEFSSNRKVRYVKVGLPEEKAYLFTASIDRVPYENLEDAVAFIIEENVPISLAESIFDFEIISEDKDTGKMKLAVSVLPRSVVDAYVALFESAGLTPISFDLESRAIAKTVIHKGDKQIALIINFSAKKTGFYVVEEEVVQFSTTLAYGLDSDNSRSSSKELLTEEMRKVITFWNARTDHHYDSNEKNTYSKKIEKIILCGSLAGKSNLVDEFMTGNKIPYTLADVWINMPHSHNRTSQMLTDEALSYASAIGLVLPNSQ